MKIDTCKLKIALAPMAGITDSAMRLMNKLGGANLVYSEMAHVNAISYNNQQILNMLKASPFEFPYVVQLFGNDQKYFAHAVKIISTKGVPVMRYKPFNKKQLEFIENLVPSYQFPVSSHNDFINKFLDFQKKLSSKNWAPALPAGRLGTSHLIPSGVDINLGCPAKRVFGHGSGAALWKNLPKIRKILEAVLLNTKLPVSIKVRTSVANITILDLLETIKDLPLTRVMIHGRSYQQGFSGEIDTAIIKKTIKKYSQFEFWVNGGIVDRKSALSTARKTGCPNLGIARGALGNPLLAEKINNLENSSTRKLASLITLNCLLAYIHSILAFQSKGPRGIIEMRKHLTWYFKDFPGAKTWRKKLVGVESIKEIEKNLSTIL